MSQDRKHLEQLLRDHDELRKAFYDNATLHAWIKQAQHGRCTAEEALIGAVVHLAGENKKLFDEIVEIKAKQAASITTKREPAL